MVGFFLTKATDFIHKIPRKLNEVIKKVRILELPFSLDHRLWTLLIIDRNEGNAAEEQRR